MVLPLQYETNLETAYGDMVTEDEAVELAVRLFCTNGVGVYALDEPKSGRIT